jgi:hypothetical protein
MSNLVEVIRERRRSSATSDTDIKAFHKTRVWKSKDQINVPDHVLEQHAADEAAEKARSTVVGGSGEEMKLGTLSEGVATTSTSSKATSGTSGGEERRRRATVQPEIKAISLITFCS